MHVLSVIPNHFSGEESAFRPETADSSRLKPLGMTNRKKGSDAILRHEEWGDELLKSCSGQRLDAGEIDVMSAFTARLWHTCVKM